METIFFQARSRGLPTVVHLPHDGVFTKRPNGHLPDEYDILADNNVIIEVRYHEARGQIECNIAHEDTPIGFPLSNGWKFASGDGYYAVYTHSSGAIYVMFLSGIRQY